MTYPIILNGRWRITDDPIQWVLERRKTKDWSKAQGERFHRRRPALIRSIRELCGEVDLSALAQVENLPERHVDWYGEQPVPMERAA